MSKLEQAPGHSASPDPAIDRRALLAFAAGVAGALLWVGT